MLRRLPPLNALKAFEAAARHESFTRAAEELCVTQGAVSHQVKALEAELGIKLFNRERQRLVITGAGRDYLTVVRDALDRIAVGTERLMQRQSSGVLTVSTSPDFAAKWLVHRLGRFSESHPEIDLRISATAPCRLRTRGCRSCGPARRRQLARARCDTAVPRTIIRCLQSQAPCGASPPGPAFGCPEVSLAPPRRSQGVDKVARGCRRSGRRAFTGSGVESRQHGYRCRGRRPGNSPRAHHACSVGPHLRAPRSAVQGCKPAFQDLLDRLPEGDI
jgi:DNA-binding transcriptional LysR family regulator